MPTQDDNTEGVWRDEERLPLADLVQAVARSAEDGQDDEADLAGTETTRSDPDPDSEAGRALRTDFTGPTGPN